MNPNKRPIPNFRRRKSGVRTITSGLEDVIPPQNKKPNKLLGFSPQSELYRPSDRRLSAKLVPTLADGVAWSAQRIPTAVNFCFLDRCRDFLETAPQLSSRG
jgi:hypothetical protein